MMHVKVIAIGKLKEKFWSDACVEYLKRMKSYACIEVIEIPDVDPARAGGEEQAIAQESAAILKALSSNSEKQLSILLDIEGKLVSSENIATVLNDSALDGINNLTFIIGGSCGVNQKVREACDMRISLGRITLPHNLARVVLLEQLYRAFKIMRKEPYHK